MNIESAREYCLAKKAAKEAALGAGGEATIVQRYVI